MRIAQYHSHFNGREFLSLHKPDVQAEVLTAIGTRELQCASARTGSAIDGPSPDELVHLAADLSGMLRACGWAEVATTACNAANEPEKSLPSYLIKERVSLTVSVAAAPYGAHDVYAKHLALYVKDLVDVGLSIVPMQTIGQDGSARTPYYEEDFIVFSREARGCRRYRCYW